MSMEKEALTNTIESDLAKRNRNWDKVDEHLADMSAHDIGTLKSRFISELMGSGVVTTKLVLPSWRDYILVMRKNLTGKQSGLYLLSTFAVPNAYITTINAASDITSVAVDADGHIKLTLSDTAGQISVRLISIT